MPTSRPSKHYWQFALLLAALVVSLVCALQMGSIAISIDDLLSLWSANPSPLLASIVLDVRLPRLLMAMSVGAGLAICGAMLQNATRNPLADPYLFGITAGAGLGATVASLYLSSHWLVLPLAAFAGASAAMAVVLSLGVAKPGQSIERFVLAGVAVSFLFSAITTLLLYLAEPFAANRVMFWLMGSLARANYPALLVVLPALVATLLVLLALRRQLDALLLSDEGARSLGVHVTRLRLVVLACCSLLAATLVAFCGGIAFVGLMIPHIVRRWFGVGTVPLLLSATLVGAIFMVWVDTAARSLLPNQEIPIGVITAAIGSLFFLVLMLKKPGTPSRD